jgi:hypothetical protein
MVAFMIFRARDLECSSQSCTIPVTLFPYIDFSKQTNLHTSMKERNNVFHANGY